MTESMSAVSDALGLVRCEEACLVTASKHCVTVTVCYIKSPQPLTSTDALQTQRMMRRLARSDALYITIKNSARLLVTIFTSLEFR